MSTNNERTVSLVLGSGGARGLAHIGVIHCLEKRGFRVKAISGCSMGALIGGIYAAGKLDEFESWVRKITKVDIVRLLDLSWKKSGLVKGDRLFGELTELVGDVAIEDLPVKYTAVATDIFNEKEIWMNSGRLFDAIRASISLPLFFTPFRFGDIDLIDGGVLNPVPIAPTFGDITDLTIAVSLGGKADNNDAKTTEDDPIKEKKTSLTWKLAKFVKRLKGSTANRINKEWDAYDIANQAFDVMQSAIARQKLAAYPADHIIEIPRNACRTLEFDLAPAMIELGYKKAEQLLSRIT